MGLYSQNNGSIRYKAKGKGCGLYSQAMEWGEEFPGVSRERRAGGGFHDNQCYPPLSRISG